MPPARPPGLATRRNKERPADEGICRAYQPRHFDFVALREDLQPDGVEGDGNEGKGEPGGEHQHCQPAQSERGLQTLGPRRVELRVRDLGPTREFVAQLFQGLRAVVCGIDDKMRRAVDSARGWR